MEKERLRPGIQRIISNALGVSKSMVNQVNCGIRQNAEVARLLELAKTDSSAFVTEIKAAKKVTDDMNELYAFMGVNMPYKHTNRRKKAAKLEVQAEEMQKNTKNISNDVPAHATVL